MQRLYSTALALFVFLTAAATLNDSNLVLLNKVERAFANVDAQRTVRRIEIDSLLKQRDAMESSLNRVLLTEKIADMYRLERIDSALHFWKLAGIEANKLQFSDKSIELQTTLLFSSFSAWIRE